MRFDQAAIDVFQTLGFTISMDRNRETGSILDRAHIAGARLEVWRLSDEPKREFTVLIHLPNGRTMQCFAGCLRGLGTHALPLLRGGRLRTLLQPVALHDRKMPFHPEKVTDSIGESRRRRRHLDAPELWKMGYRKCG
jgi:hypothetical protein